MPYSFKEIEKKLTKLGYKIVRQKGSHVIFDNGKSTFPVPRYDGKQISPGVESSILRILEISKDDFAKL